jgi:hypothetical protein
LHTQKKDIGGGLYGDEMQMTMTGVEFYQNEGAIGGGHMYLKDVAGVFSNIELHEGYSVKS